MNQRGEAKPSETRRVTFSSTGRLSSGWLGLKRNEICWLDAAAALCLSDASEVANFSEPCLMMTEAQLGLEQDPVFCPLSTVDDHSAARLRCATAAVFQLLSADGRRPRHEQDFLKGINKIWIKKIWIKKKMNKGTMALDAPLRHQCLLVCGPFRELLDPARTKQVTVGVQKVLVVFSSTFRGKKSQRQQSKKEWSNGILDVVCLMIYRLLKTQPYTEASKNGFTLETDELYIAYLLLYIAKYTYLWPAIDPP